MIDRSRTVAQIVLDHSSTAAVFQRHRIDYCCRGGVTVAEACGTRVDPNLVFDELEAAVSERSETNGRDARQLTTEELVAYVVTRHHAYLRRALPFLRPLAAKVARVHGDHDPRLRAIDETFRALADALDPHLDEEEAVLFPALVAGGNDRALVDRELSTMHEDHLAVGELLQRVRALSEDFSVPEWACTSYRTLFAELANLETDILAHVHLENHVLMPRFVAPQVS